MIAQQQTSDQLPLVWTNRFCNDVLVCLLSLLKGERGEPGPKGEQV